MAMHTKLVKPPRGCPASWYTSCSQREARKELDFLAALCHRRHTGRRECASSDVMPGKGAPS